MNHQNEALVLSGDVQRWIDRFIADHHRPPRILHIGNIANNAYNNAKLLIEAGITVHVLCNDYYHSMGCPEWEDADMETGPANHDRPDWSACDLRGFARPRWFVQGPLELCAKYLTVLNKGATDEVEAAWRELGLANGTIKIANPDHGILGKWPIANGLWTRFTHLGRINLARVKALLLLPLPLYRLAGWLHRRVDAPGLTEACGMVLVSLLLLILAPLRLVFSLLISDQSRSPDGLISRDRFSFPAAFRGRYESLYGQRVHEFEREILSFLDSIHVWREVCAEYDLVQGYATAPIWPFLAGKRPYVAFEHGTLRDVVRGENLSYRAAGVAYMAADHVFVTNGDCLEHAQTLGITNFSPMLHPVNARLFSRSRAKPGWAQERYGARFVFLCPTRHDWAVKGTDVHIRALPLIREAIGEDFCVAFIRWGQDLAQSEKLISELQVQAQVRWIEPMAHFALARHMNASDVVLDQIKLPHFGSTAPEALAAGVPVVMSYDPKSTEWLVSRPAPILSAWTPEEVAAQVKRAVQPGFRHHFASEAKKWVEDCHSEQRVVDTHFGVYMKLIGAT